MDKPLNFQSIIMTLQHYWADQGCLIWQPYYTQVGAGTMNPATFLRVLGPEPWKVAYVEPSIRPDDGRFGENPNRLQQHYQFQVILKPDPGNPQELYLGSLEALGIDPREHDIRFVEDNWESPALGAWGLGWEVWLDGQEITQFTYFQQSGGVNLNPNSVEITYGLDRIAIGLQRVSKFQDIQWNETRTYGDVNHQGEFEHSHYYFDVADVERLKQMYLLYEEEARSALSKELVLPALDYILKCSHTFNILDTRGAVGVTERQVLFGKMRELSRSLAETYLEQRKKLEYPWLKEELSGSLQIISVPADRRHATLKTPQAEFLFEIGTEELPVGDLTTAIEQLKSRVPEWLHELRLKHGEIQVLGTPRRITIMVKDLDTQQPDETRVVKGPPAERAFDPTGKLTPAGEGFARSKGVAPESLSVQEMDGGKYAVATVEEKGRAAIDVLSVSLPDLVMGIRFEKSMRWNSSGVSFSRPIRWFLAILGGEVVPFEYAGLTSSDQTRGLRFYEPATASIHNIKEYLEYLGSQGILLDPQVRKETIKRQLIQTLVSRKGMELYDEGLLNEVTNLLEASSPVLGSFEEAHLGIPEEVLKTVLKKHQRFFPIQSGKGLLPNYVAMRNGDDKHLDIIREGYDHVVRARFADANFFINEDSKYPLASFRDKLATLLFQKKLGSMLDKTERIGKLVDGLALKLNLTPDATNTAKRAAALCKADLATKMVVEITSLQGVIGRYYALQSGETQQVADAIFEHYLPRFSGDQTPSQKAGFVVGLADRLDSLVGLFAAGMAPTGTKDPFAQRRTAIGLVQSLMATGTDFDIREGMSLAVQFLPIEVTPETLEECLKFITGRLRTLLVDEGYRYDVVDSILSVLGSNPHRAINNIRKLNEMVSQPEWTARLQAYARCVRIVRTQAGGDEVSAEEFQDSSEKKLYDAYQIAQNDLVDPTSLDEFIRCFDRLIGPINTFFEKVLVMDPNPAIRNNRLGLLKKIVALGTRCADLSLLEGF